LAEAGIEQTPFSSTNTAILADSVTKNGTIGENQPLDPLLAELIDLWPNLSQADRKLLVKQARTKAAKAVQV
jgi:hypothetical protein